MTADLTITAGLTSNVRITLPARSRLSHPQRGTGEPDSPVALALLQQASGRTAWADGIPINWERPDVQRQWQHINVAGLAPLLHHAIVARFRDVPEDWQNALQGADLSARVRHGNFVDTANEIIDVCDRLRVEPTLLKGISISERCYPAEHLRPMGDVDVLVPWQACAAVEEALLSLGYLRGPDHHPHGGRNHGAPLHHAARNVWVEIHTALFPPGEAADTSTLFGTANVEAESVTSRFHGRPVHRLSTELQLAYIARGWLSDMLHCKPNASFLPSLFDVIFLVTASRPAPDWDKLIGWMDQNSSEASLYILLSYLAHLDILACPPTALKDLATRQRLVGSPELRIIHSILDYHLLGGTSLSRFLNDWHAMICLNTLVGHGSPAAKLLLLPWNALFPPQLPDRYGVRLQLGRIRRLLRSYRQPNTTGHSRR